MIVNTFPDPSQPYLAGQSLLIFQVGAVIVIATRSILDIPTALIAIATIFALLYIKKIQEPYVIAVTAILGIFIKLIL